MDNQAEEINEEYGQSEMLKRGPTQNDVGEIQNDPDECVTPDAYQNVQNELINTRIIVTAGPVDSSQKIKIE